MVRRTRTTSTRKNLPRPDGLFVSENIKTRTAECRELLNPAVKPEQTPEEKRLQEIANLCAARFDCHAEQTRELVQLIMQVQLPQPDAASVGSKFPFVPGSLIVLDRVQYLVESTDSDGDARYYYLDGGSLARNSYIGATREGITPATDAQIDAWAKRAGLLA
jgi:hypothetical protein